MNPDAGHGNLLIIPVRLESGEELPFVVDSGTSITVLDKSIEPKLGKRMGTATMNYWGTKMKLGVYSAPKLYSGSTPLVMSGSNAIVRDLTDMSGYAGHRIMGILGMDVLENYCIQIDFAAGQIRFLDDKHADKSTWGKPFPITDLNSRDGRPAISENLSGKQGPHSLIDTGYTPADGWLMPKHFDPWTNSTAAQEPNEVHRPNGMLGGEIYPNILLDKVDVESDGIGLAFLARHLATLDFPKRMLYLKRVSIGPLPNKGPAAVMIFLKELKEKGQLPAWSKDEHGALKSVVMEADSLSGTVDVLKNNDSSIYHYRVSRAANQSSWNLEKAWRTDQSGQTIEEYSIH